MGKRGETERRVIRIERKREQKRGKENKRLAVQAMAWNSIYIWKRNIGKKYHRQFWMNMVDLG